MDLDLRQLRYFVAIAECGGFSAASEVLHIAQSALSRHVQNLEQECGGPLFERASRGIQLTTAGLLLLDRARRLLREVDSIRLDVQAENEEPTGVVRIGTTPSVAEALFTPLAVHFLNSFPKVRLELVETIKPDPSALLSRGDLDLAISSPKEAYGSLHFEPLFIEQMCVFGPVGGEGPPTPAQDGLGMLLDTPLVVPVGTGWMPKLGLLLGERVSRLQVRLEVVGMTCMKQMVAAGLGRGIVPHWTLSRELAEKRFWAVPIKGFTQVRALARSRDRPIGRIGIEFAGAVRHVVRGMGKLEGIKLIGDDAARALARDRTRANIQM
jgi:LysR family transcriptional regulator, nitrogen assimilation regulatory protein